MREWKWPRLGDTNESDCRQCKLAHVISFLLSFPPPNITEVCMSPYVGTGSSLQSTIIIIIITSQSRHAFKESGRENPPVFQALI